MGYNVYQGQVIGPFSNGEEIALKIKQNVTNPSDFILWHLGIQTEVKAKFIFGTSSVNNTLTIGKTGIYEIGNFNINLSSLTLKSLQDLPASTIIDYVVVPK